MTTTRTALMVGLLTAVALTAPTTSFAAPEGEGRGPRTERGGSIERSPRGEDDKTIRDRRNGDEYWRAGRRRGADVDVRVRDRDWRGPGYRDRIRRGHRYAWGPGFSFYFTDGYYYGDCRWLKRRAYETGARVWWRRYERCRDYAFD